MRASACILVLFVLVAACRRHPEPAASADAGIQKRLAGVWSHEQKSRSGQVIVADTIEVNPDGTCASVATFPKRKLGPRSAEQSGTWRIEDGVLIFTITRDSVTNAQVPSVGRFKIVRLDDRELELEWPDEINGISFPTDTVVYRKQTR